MAEHDEMTRRARELRKNMTPEERRLWYEYLRGYPVRFMRQRVIDRYILDFYCAEARLAVELDGSQHYEEQGAEYDAKRTEDLNALGILVLRIPNNEVNRNLAGVCEMIDTLVQQRRKNRQ